MKGLKFTVGFAFLLSLASLGGNWFLFERFQAERTAREQTESKLVQLEDQNAFLQSQAAKVTQYEQETKRLQAQVKDYVNQRDALKKELDQASGEATQLKKRIKELESEKQTLAARVNDGEARENAVVEETKKLPPVQAVAPLSAAPVKLAKGEKATAEKKKAPAPKTEIDQRPHQVLSVNRQFNFVVVNVGLRDRLKMGDTLRVEQNGKLIGRIQVEKLYENFSACTIIEEIQPAKIQEGDLLRIV